MAGGEPSTDSQTSHVLEGEVTFYLPGESRVLSAGGCIALPPPSDDLPSMEDLLAAAAEHGLEILGPPGALP